MKKVLTVAFTGISIVLILCTFNYAQEVGEAKRPDEEHAQPPAGTFEESIGEYEYVISSVLDEQRDKFVGKYIKFVDDLAVLWDDPTPHDSDEDVEETRQKGFKGDHDNQTARPKYAYLKFETYYFRCLLPEEYDESVNYIRHVNRRKTFDEIEQLKPERKLLCIYGKLIRSTVWGKVAQRGAEQGTETEDIAVMVHRIERPAPRFFKEVPNEEDQ
jgi:hypothetical protein